MNKFVGMDCCFLNNCNAEKKSAHIPPNESCPLPDRHEEIPRVYSLGEQEILSHKAKKYLKIIKRHEEIARSITKK